MYQTTTQVFRVAPAAIDQHLIAFAAKILVSGGLVAFPTETVYGLVANAMDPQAVDRIFAAKERPFSDPLIVHIADIRQLGMIAEDVPDLAWRLAEAFWPGPLTMVLKRSTKVARNVSAGMDSVAARMPAHAIAQALIRAAGVPVAAPSANRFTRPSPTTAQHVLDDLAGHVDVILDGGSCPIGLESTVLDLLSSPPVILRPGGLPLEFIRRLAPQVTVHPRYIQAGSNEPAQSPGMQTRHYSPKAKLVLVVGEASAVQTRLYMLANEHISAGHKVGIMAADEDTPTFERLPVLLYRLGARENLDQIGANLFAAIRALDQASVDIILVGEFSLEGLGLAIRDRLLRAADGQAIHA